MERGKRRFKVYFSVNCADTHVGLHVRVVGSVAALGEWDPQKGLVLNTSASDFPNWKQTEPTPLEEGVVEYKYVICDNNGAAVRWEERANRTLHIADLVEREMVPPNSSIAITENFVAYDRDEMRFRSSPVEKPHDSKEDPTVVKAALQENMQLEVDTKQAEVECLRREARGTLLQAACDGRLASAFKEMRKEVDTKQAEVECLRREARGTLLQAACDGRSASAFKEMRKEVDTKQAEVECLRREARGTLLQAACDDLAFAFKEADKIEALCPQQAGLRIQRWWRSCMIRREEMFADLVRVLADLREEAAREIQYSVGIVRRGGSLRSFGRRRF